MWCLVPHREPLGVLELVLPWYYYAYDYHHCSSWNSQVRFTDKSEERNINDELVVRKFTGLGENKVRWASRQSSSWDPVKGHNTEWWTGLTPFLSSGQWWHREITPRLVQTYMKHMLVEDCLNFIDQTSSRSWKRISWQFGPWQQQLTLQGKQRATV